MSAQPPEDPDRPPDDAAARARAVASSMAAPIDPIDPTRGWQIAAFAAVYLIWGSTYLAIRIAVHTIPPFFLAGARFVLAGGFLFLLFRARGVALPTARQWSHAAAAGVMMLALGNGLVTWAEQRVPSNIAALLIAGSPLYVALIEWARPSGRRPTRGVFLGIAVGAVGLLLLVSERTPRGGAALDVLGTAAVIFASFSWSAGSLYVRYVAKAPHGGIASAQQMIVGGASMLLFSAARGEPVRAALAHVEWPAVAAFAYLTVFGSIVAFSAFSWLLQVSTPQRVSTATYVNPVVAVILGWALLDEVLGPRAIAGAAVILVAVIVMTAGPTLRARLGRARAV